MNLISSDNKILKILSFLIAILPISLLCGSLIINIVTIFISLIFISEIITNRKTSFFFNWSFFLLLFLWISFLINLFFSQDSYLSVSRVIGFIRFIFLAYSIKYIFSHKNQVYKNFILKIWLIIFIIVSCDLLYEYFMGRNILGYQSNLEGRLASFLGEELKIGGYYFGFCLISLATIYYLFKKDYRILFVFVIIFLNISFIIGERSNFLKILISILIILIFYFREHKTKVLSLVLLCSLTFLSIVYKNDDLKYRYLIQLNKENISENIYFTHYKTAIFVFKKYPIFGSGIKNFRIEVRKIIDENFKDNSTYNNWQVITTHPHQVNFEILAETGLFGYLCFLIFFIITFFKAFKKLLRENNLLLLVSSVFCLIYLNPILPSGSFFTTYGATIFWTNFGIMISFLNSNKRID